MNWVESMTYGNFSVFFSKLVRVEGPPSLDSLLLEQVNAFGLWVEIWHNVQVLAGGHGLLSVWHVIQLQFECSYGNHKMVVIALPH